MYELSELQTESAAGGNPFTTALTIAKTAWELAKAFEQGMSAVGGTLNNYYGEDMTLQIVAAGNMGA